MQLGIKELQWLECFKVVFLELRNMQLCRVSANQVTGSKIDVIYCESCLEELQC